MQSERKGVAFSPVIVSFVLLIFSIIAAGVVFLMLQRFSTMENTSIDNDAKKEQNR